MFEVKLSGGPWSPRPLGVPRGHGSSMRELMQQVYADSRAALAGARGAHDLKVHIGRFHERVDALAMRGFAESHSTLACRAGCSYCCYLKVDAKPGEVFRIVDYLRKNFTPAEIDAVQAKAEEIKRKIAPMTAEQHMAANLPCALLKDEQCSVYAVRPFQCRAFHAQTVTTCVASFEQPERLDLPHSQVPAVRLMLNAAHEAESRATEDTGYDNQAYDLNVALTEALGNERCERRWRDGKKAFSQSAAAKEPQG